MYDFGVRQAHSGYRISYRQNAANHCPGCGQSQWMIGRLTAECAFCGTALPLISGGSFGTGIVRTGGVPAMAPLAA